MSVDATSATSVAGRSPRLCSELASSSVATPMMTAASTAVARSPCVKQMIATTATASAGHDRGRAGRGPSAASRSARSASSRLAAAALRARPAARWPSGRALTRAAPAPARSRANAASSSTGPSFDSAPSFTCSPERSSAKSDSDQSEPSARNRGCAPVTVAHASGSSGGLGVVGEDRGHRAGRRLGPVRQRRHLAGRRVVELASQRIVGRLARAGRRLGRRRLESATPDGGSRRPDRDRAGGRRRCSPTTSARERGSATTDAARRRATSARAAGAGSRRSSWGSSSSRTTSGSSGVVEPASSALGSRRRPEAGSGLLGAQDAHALEGRRVRRRTGRSRVPHPRVAHPGRLDGHSPASPFRPRTAATPRPQAGSSRSVRPRAAPSPCGPTSCRSRR